jgi:hypothetical protein
MPALLSVPVPERVQRTTTKAVHGDPLSLRQTESRLRSCIDSKAANRVDGDRNAGQSGGDDASGVLCSGVVACGWRRGIWGFVAFDQPGIHAGGSAAALHA